MKRPLKIAELLWKELRQGLKLPMKIALVACFAVIFASAQFLQWEAQREVPVGNTLENEIIEISADHLVDKDDLAESNADGRRESAENSWLEGLQPSDVYLRRNEALVNLLVRSGLQRDVSSELTLKIRDEVDLTSLRTDKPITLLYEGHELGQEGEIPVGFRIAGREKEVSSYLFNDEVKLRVHYHVITPRIFARQVEVRSSLYQDGLDTDIPAGILLDMFNRYTFDINFQSDIREGTKYELIYTMDYNERGERVGMGQIIYANIALASGQRFPIFQFADLDGQNAYYNEQGKSVNKALLLVPVNGAYLSSTFGYRRDPIMGRLALHRGTDYACPVGTPIKAGGNGRIVVRGWSRVGYGNYIIIRHTNGYETLYGHMSRFRSGLSVGSYVQQGDIIGYVGSTGRSTGPHVHYEVRHNGVPINIRSLRLQASKSLAGQELNLYMKQIQAVQARFAGILPLLDQVGALGEDQQLALGLKSNSDHS